MVLTITNLTKQFGALLTLNNVDLSVGQGEVVSLIGPSGCGKSTLLRIAAGLDRHFTGHVSVAGRAVESPSPEVGVVFQEPRLMPWLDVAKNIAFGVSGLAPADPRVARAAAQVGLDQFLHALPRELSGGMAQRCAIARALIAKPGILLLDEPFSALDPFTRMQLQDLLVQLAQTERTTMLLVTHDVDEALYVSDRIIVLSGRPSRVVDEIVVDRPHPRDRRDSRLASLRGRILDSLTDQEALAAVGV